VEANQTSPGKPLLLVARSGSDLHPWLFCSQKWGEGEGELKGGKERGTLRRKRKRASKHGSE